MRKAILRAFVFCVLVAPSDADATRLFATYNGTGSFTLHEVDPDTAQSTQIGTLPARLWRVFPVAPETTPVSTRWRGSPARHSGTMSREST
jgi:hypothetical protein